MNDIQELVRRCANGESKAQSLLYNEFKGKLMGVCYRYASKPEEAEDIFQEAFYAILKHIGKATEYDNVFTWMRRITINKAINYYKKNLKHQEGRNDDNELLERVPDSNFSTIESSIDVQQLLSMVNTLPAGYRVVFNMYVLDGYSHKEVAESLKISENTSKSQLFKAKALLREKVNTLNKISYEHN